MLIKTITATVAETIVLSKGYSSLLFNCTTALNGAERLTVFVQSKDENKYIFNDMAVKDILHLASYQDESKLKVYTLAGVSYLLELTADGGQVPLVEGEQLIIKTSGFGAGLTYNMFGMDAPYISKNLLIYEEKIFPAGEKTRSYDVTGYDLFGIDQITDITEVTLRWNNGASTKYTTEEFQALASSLDPELFDNPPTANSIAVIPLGNQFQAVEIQGQEVILTVVGIEVIKPSANAVTLIFRNDVSDWNKYRI